MINGKPILSGNSFEKDVRLLTEVSEQEARFVPRSDSPLPSVASRCEVVDLVRQLVFPGYFDRRQNDEKMRSYHIGVNMERLFEVLSRQILLALQFQHCSECEADEKRAVVLAQQFIDQLPEVKRLLFTDVEAIFNNDPAAATPSEVIFCYPVVQAMLHYRLAHVLQDMKIPVIPRIITEKAHGETGIDIHPCAKIGEYFAIDHGTGVVIGETCIIGNHVTLYQGVTLGAAGHRPFDSNNFDGEQFPRHPVLEDNVTVYSSSTRLGRITIGHDTIIGGNIWVTHDVPPNSRLRQSKFVDSQFEGGLGI